MPVPLRVRVAERAAPVFSEIVISKEVALAATLLASIQSQLLGTVTVIASEKLVLDTLIGYVPPLAATCIGLSTEM